MARYQPAIVTETPETVVAQPGQWLRYGHATGRYMGRRNGVIWIAWDGSARKRFAQFAAAFNRGD